MVLLGQARASVDLHFTSPHLGVGQRRCRLRKTGEQCKSKLDDEKTGNPIRSFATLQA